MSNDTLTRGGAVVARRAHNPKVVGSSPAPATKHYKGLREIVSLFSYSYVEKQSCKISTILSSRKILPAHAFWFEPLA